MNTHKYQIIRTNNFLNMFKFYKTRHYLVLQGDSLMFPFNCNRLGCDLVYDYMIQIRWYFLWSFIYCKKTARWGLAFQSKTTETFHTVRIKCVCNIESPSEFQMGEILFNIRKKINSQNSSCIVKTNEIRNEVINIWV